MKVAYALTLGVALSLYSQASFAQATGRSDVAPTAESAAQQVGKSPASAKTNHGKRIEPSQKLWNNPRTVAEQPGSVPPANKTTNDHSKPLSSGEHEKDGPQKPQSSDSNEQQ